MPAKTKKKTAARRSQEDRRDESRAKILAAAERLFARDGLEGARTDAITAEAGVNKALLYYYFKSKDSLYEAVIEEHLREFNGQALAILKGAGSARALLLRYVELHFDFMSRRRRHAPLFQQLMMKGGKRAERLFREYIVPRSLALQQLLARGMQAGEFRQVDPFHTVISVVGLVVFYFAAAPMMQLAGQAGAFSEAGLKRRKQEVLNFVRHGLFVDPNQPTL